MKPPVKTENIRHILRQRIRNKVYAAEAMLPGELALMREFAVSRNTIRAALKRLAEENLIHRIRGRGTLVNLYSNMLRATVSLLLPCPDYMSNAGPMWFQLRDMVEGALASTQKHDVGLELLSVSQTNNLDDIDFNTLNHLNSESLVIISSEWYRPLFRFLQTSGARCLLVNNRNFRNEAHCQALQPLPKKFQLITIDVRMLFEQAVLYLHNIGCHKIALYAPLSTPHNALMEGYSRGISYTTKQAPCIMSNAVSTDELPTFPRLAEHLRYWQKREQFDALIFCARDTRDNSVDQIFNNQTLGMPDSVKIVMAYQVPYQAIMRPQLPAIYFDNAMIGRNCVKMLLYPEVLPRNLIWQPVWKFPKNSDI